MQRRYWLIIALIFFLVTVPVAGSWLRLPTHNSDTELSVGPGFSTLANTDRYDCGYLSQESTLVSLIDYATLYTNLTSSVWLVATQNNSILNCKNYLWIHAHQNLTNTPLGPLIEGSVTRTRLVLIGQWFNFTTPDRHFFSIRLRQINNAQDIDEIRQDVESYQATINFNLAISYVIQGVFGAIIATALVGRWKMSTISK